MKKNIMIMAILLALIPAMSLAFPPSPPVVYSGGKIILGGSAVQLPPPIGTIGTPGAMGFGVSSRTSLPSGFTALSGHDDPYSWNYGNYQYADGSIMVWIPKFYYYVTDGTTYPVNTVLIKGTDYFATTAAANAAGYALHRAFIDGGLEKPGFFFDKYKSSKIAIGTGWGAGSIANGNPISTAAAHNPIADLTSSGGTNAYYRAIDAAHARDGVNGAVNAASIFHVPSKFQYAALAMLSLAHAQASSAATPACAWYMAASNFPKGNNNNALADTNDTSVLYTTDGYSNAGKTGSGKPFAKTTHNGQPSGVCDLNGGMYEISLGITAIATTVAIEDLSRANPCVVTWTGHGLATGDYVQVGSTAITDAVWVPLTGKIYKITKVNDNSFSLDGADSSGFASAYVPATDPGTITKGSFYTAKQSIAMKSFTSGNSGATDHWGATGVAAMMDAFVPIFKTAYPNNVWGLRMGSGTAQVISNATSGAGWLLAGLGFPVSVSAIDASGTAQFGADYYYQYIQNELCLTSCYSWGAGSGAGVWASGWDLARSYSATTVGFRAACYPD
jgi:hypothetical protein